MLLGETSSSYTIVLASGSSQPDAAHSGLLMLVAGTDGTLGDLCTRLKVAAD